MRKTNFKGRCTKRNLSKCNGICRTYDNLQTKYAEMLEADESIEFFRCNVCLEDGEDNQYMTDFVATKTDGRIMVRECVRRKSLSKPMTAKLLDLSRHYWLSRGVTDWGIVVEKEEHDESQ